jgi:16S rRNA (guanine527-N7)-methyltransferase
MLHGVTAEEFHARLTTRAETAGLTISSDLASPLEAYYRLLYTWNQRINLTGLDLETLPDEAVDRLLIEPLAAAHHAAPNSRVLDIGSGGGSPAIPFALASHAASLAMVESRSKKSVFLTEAARVVGLHQVRVITARFESVADSPGILGTFDVVTIRAVRIANDDWKHLAKPLRSGGSLLLLHQSDVRISAGDGFTTQEIHRLTSRAQLSVLRRSV